MRHGNHLALITEDIGAEPLARHIEKQALDVPVFLGIAVQVADALARIHRHNIIHKDINPNNIIWDPDTGVLRIIDFDISSTLQREKPTVRNPNVLEGTLVGMLGQRTGLPWPELYSRLFLIYTRANGDLAYIKRELLKLLDNDEVLVQRVLAALADDRSPDEA